MQKLKELAAIGSSSILVVALAACSNTESTSPSETWTPVAFPAIDDSGVVPPKGPQALSVKITGPNSSGEGTGYIQLEEDGSCSLDAVFEETDKATNLTTTYWVTKSPSGPAYISTDQALWLDTRDPNSPISPLLTFINPIGISLSGDTRYQSLCFLAALPALTSPSLSTGEFPWDQGGIETFMSASNQSFVSEVLRLAGASPEEYSRVAAAVVELAGLPVSEFASSASLVQVDKAGNATTISYFFGIEESVKVEIGFTPTGEKIISPPPTAQKWEEEISIFRDTSGVAGVLERYFAVS